MKRIVLKTGSLCFLLICIVFSMSRYVQAADTNEWEKEWENLRKQMELESDSVLKEEINFGNENMSTEEKSTSLKSYDIRNAIPICTLSSDETMLSDYHKNNDDFSKLIEWNNRWYVPATTMTDAYASILLQKETDGYQIYAQYFGDDDIYIADTANEIKDKVKKELKNTKIEQIQNISIPFYKINLIYIKQFDGKEKVIPYQANGATTLNDINEKSGNVYSVSRFISDMERVYEEYTEQELEQIIEKNKTEMSIGGPLEPKKKVSGEINKENSSSVKNYFFIVIIVLLVAFAGVIFIRAKAKCG